MRPNRPPRLLVVASGKPWRRGSLPEIDGEPTAFGSAGPVELVRDRHGIPHIFAVSEDDALFSLGHVQSQDRVWRIEERGRFLDSGRRYCTHDANRTPIECRLRRYLNAHPRIATASEIVRQGRHCGTIEKDHSTRFCGVEGH